MHIKNYAIPKNRTKESQDLSHTYVSIWFCIANCTDHNSLSFFAITSQIENCSRFWFQPTKYSAQVKAISDELNKRNSGLELFRKPADICIGQILAAVQRSDGKYYRAKVISIEREKFSNAFEFEVVYI